MKRNRSLRTLKIGKFLLSLCRIGSPTVFIDLLAALPNLGILEHNLHYLDEYQLLGQLEHLCSFSSRYFTVSEALDHRQSYKNIRSLSKHYNMSQLHVAWILKDFPNLEYLSLWRIDNTQPNDPEVFRIIGNSLLKLKGICVDSVNDRMDRNI
ncbi:hypothetical protein BG015_005415 [Linnemannia schmuckeri]|uniref:Uncharacterized protein n=1 Tax=Linnemannia schmuckeri TaxID=64567 RepID=A0A9P5R7X1_9FUNG|nr:hypothetical protein BG015_005415 [Linnemannia schmuckeri]